MANVRKKYPNSFYVARKNYFQCQNLLNRISPTLKTYVDNLYQILPSKDIYKIVIAPIKIDDDTLIDIIKEFFYSFNDKDIRDAFDYIIENKLYEIIPASTDPESDIYDGYVAKTYTNSKNCFVKIFRRYNIKDIHIGVHEFAHGIIQILFTNKISPIFYYFLSENESFYFELLFIKKFLPLIVKNNEYIPFVLEQNKCAFVCNNIILNKNLLDYYQNKYILKENRNRTFEKDVRCSCMMIHSIIHSYMLALQQVDLTISDKDKGLYTFKSMLTEPIDKIDSVEKLLEKYDMDYTQTNPLFESVLEDHKRLKKMIDNGVIV